VRIVNIGREGGEWRESNLLIEGGIYFRQTKVAVVVEEVVMTLIASHWPTVCLYQTCEVKEGQEEEGMVVTSDLIKRLQHGFQVMKDRDKRSHR
jgi:hypothetical protein